MVNDESVLTSSSFILLLFVAVDVIMNDDDIINYYYIFSYLPTSYMNKGDDCLLRPTNVATIVYTVRCCYTIFCARRDFWLAVDDP